MSNVVEYLVRKWRDSIRAKAYEGRLPIHEAARSGDLRAVRFSSGSGPSRFR
jgi:hypothetical protein